MFFNDFPYTNFHELNLDWILQQIQSIEQELKNFIQSNTIKYADPIGWDITQSYESNTVVIDAHTGNAYISTKPVPNGIHVTNTDYWTPIFNYTGEFHTFRDTIATDEQTNTTASRNYAVGECLYKDTTLYRVVKYIRSADSLVPGDNLEEITLSNYLIAKYNQSEKSIELAGTITV